MRRMEAARLRAADAERSSRRERRELLQGTASPRPCTLLGLKTECRWCCTPRPRPCSKTLRRASPAAQRLLCPSARASSSLCSRPQHLLLWSGPPAHLQGGSDHIESAQRVQEHIPPSQEGGLKLVCRSPAAEKVTETQLPEGVDMWQCFPCSPGPVRAAPSFRGHSRCL